MTRDEIKRTIDDYLSLIEKGCGSTEENEVKLKFLLDKLAWAQHFANFEFDDKEYPDAPRKEYMELLKLANSRFPNYGDYSVVLDPEKIIGLDEPEIGIAKASDDIADIALDLAEAKWRWENNSPEDGLWTFTFQFNHHWGEHLRELQNYLIHLEQKT